MAVAISTPVSRADDVRSLKFRLRRVTFSGNYQDDQTESVVTAANVGLNFIAAVIPCTGVLPASAFTTANEFAIEVASNGKQVEFWLYENAAAGSPSAQKTDNEAFITGQFGDFIFLGW